MKKVYRFLSLFFICLLVTLSCTIGLGPSVDLTAPTLTVNTPERNTTVTQIVTVSGTVTDDIGVSSITVSIDETGQSYKWSDSKWQYLVDNNWIDYPSGSASGEATNISWSVDIPVVGSNSGESYTLVVRATDSMGNEGKSSKDERSFTVDFNEPNVSITSPSITKEYALASSKFSSYKLRDNNILQDLVNQDIRISGYQKEDCKLDSLYVYIDEKTDSSLPAKNVAITDYLLKRTITGSSLRNWETVITETDLPSELSTGKHLLRLITESHDSAGNIERKVQGWFTYWNEADAPWISAGFGYDDLASIANNVYPSCALQGYAYDDDGLKTVVIDVYKLDVSKNPNEWVKDTERSLNINLDEEDNPKFKNWTIYSFVEACKFKIKATCTDINGKTSVSEVERFMSVSDVNPPRITVTTNTQDPLFGDEAGNFYIKGNVIDDDKDHIPSLVLVWIKDSENISKYVDVSYQGWKAPENRTADFIDNGDKHFVIPLGAADSQHIQYYNDFSLKLNLFTDLGISITESGNKLETQNFALKATDSGDQSSTTFVSIAGDYEMPSLSIDKIFVEGVEEPYVFKDPSRIGNLVLNPFERNPDGSIKSKVKLSGTWKDNSTDVWKSIANIGQIMLSWKDAPDLVVTMNLDGSWESNEIVPPDASTGSITASLVDIGGNVATVNECFNININKPELVRISALTTDGSYKKDKKIEITLDFNKPVTFSEGTTPELKLNIPDGESFKKAIYKSGNGTAQHVYEYTVVQNDNITELDVTQIIKNGNIWKDDKDAVVDNVDVGAITVDANKLKGNRKIQIDTTLPQIHSISKITSNGSYKAAKDIYFTLEFDESVTLSDVNQIKLKFKGNIESTKVEKTGSKTLLFTYTTAPGENANPLKIDYVDFGNCIITDNALNVLPNSRYTPGVNAADGIIIDTTPPVTPEIVFSTSGILGNGETMYVSSVNFKIKNFESDSNTKKMYSIDGQRTWIEYTGSIVGDSTEDISISTNGDYEIFAYQEDLAGNQSPVSTGKSFTLNAGNLLTNVTSDIANGTYTVGQVINFILSFRDKVKADGTTLQLEDILSSGSFSRTASYSSISSDEKTVTYTYTVQEGDSCGKLNVSGINGDVKNGKDQVIPAAYYSMPTGHGFNDNRDSISIVTGKPTVVENGFEFNGSDRITIEFDRPISKGSGTISIIQNKTKSPYLVPAVLSEKEYNNISNIDNYYTEGTNGSLESGKSNVEKKYILNFEDESGNPLMINSDSIVSKFIEAGNFEVNIDVGSNAVSIDNTKLIIDLTTANEKALPVKGVYYDFTLDEDFVVDAQSHGCDKIEMKNDKALFRDGVEKPFIRIKKSSGGAIWDNTSQAVVVEQPLTTIAYIDCRTPNAKITYTLKEVISDPHNYSIGTPSDGIILFDGVSAGPVETYRSNIELGKDSSGNIIEYKKGYAVLIEAIAQDDSVQNNKSKTSDKSWETAYRSVARLPDTFKNGTTDTLSDNEVKLQNNTYAHPYNQMWVRGGDAPKGGIVTPGFPLSYDTEKLDKIKAMSFDSDDTEHPWYWVSWELNTTSYVHFLRGDLPKIKSEVNNGPTVWCWSCQSFIQHKDESPLNPGRSIEFRSDSSDPTEYDKDGQQLTFYNKHCEHRHGTTIIKEKANDALNCTHE